MKKPSWQKLGSCAAALACGLLSAACTGSVDGPSHDTPGTGGTGGSGLSTGGSGVSGGAAGQGGSGSGASGGAGGSGSTAGTGVGGSGGPGSGGSAGSGVAPPVYVDPPPYAAAPGMLRRLTRTQFANAIRDLLGAEVDTTKLETDSWYGNFAVIGAGSVSTSETGVEAYHTAVETAVATVFDDPAKQSGFIGCDPTVMSDTCLRGFIERVGRRAWRRPLELAEVERLTAVAATATTELGSAVEGVRWATVALLTSPNFLYRPELGVAGAGGGLAFTGYEMATRLAFLFWNSLADDVLLDAAAAGSLATPEGVRSAAERLLDTAAGRESVGAFAEEYLRLDRITTQAKGPAFTEYVPALQAGMVRDLRETWEVIAFDDGASIMDVFSTPKVVVNAELATLYGIDATGLDSGTFEVRSLPADGPRAGVLSKAGFLSQFANQKYGSPTLRGKFMRESLLCEPVEPPPGDVDVVIEDPPADMPMTRRQQLELHRSDPTCAGCHALMDPLGLPLESYDAIGRYRTTERDLPIDSTGVFIEQAVANSRELGLAVASSIPVAQCLVRKYYSYALGRVERPEDGSVINDLAASFQASGFRMRDLVLDIATHQAFSTVAPQPQ
jgi:hypothetical protein